MCRIVEHVLNAVGSAGDFLTMWFHMLIVISALTTVLMHGQLSTIENEYDIDSQFNDFYYSISTMTIYLIGTLLQSLWEVLSMIACWAGGNFVEVVQPALESHGLYILLFLAISLAALFFVSAVLIEIFMGSYEKVLPHTSELIDIDSSVAYQADEGVFPSSGRRRRWAGLTAAFFAWTQAKPVSSRARPVPTPTHLRVCVELSNLSSMAPGIQEEARAQQAGEQTRFEAGCVYTDSHCSHLLGKLHPCVLTHTSTT